MDYVLKIDYDGQERNEPYHTFSQALARSKFYRLDPKTFGFIIIKVAPDMTATIEKTWTREA